MSLRDVPREQLQLGVTRLRTIEWNEIRRDDGLFAGFEAGRIGEVLVKFPEAHHLKAYSVDDCEVAQ